MRRNDDKPESEPAEPSSPKPAELPKNLNEFEQIAARLAQLSRKDDVNPKEAGAENLGPVIALSERKPTGNLRLEQNLGCELPVCVANRKDANAIAIEFKTDEGSAWRLVRSAATKLPAPEHYRYWTWFLDACYKAHQTGVIDPPRIMLNPPELYRLFGGGRNGSWYNTIDDAFTRFSHLIVEQKTAFFKDGREYEMKAVIGLLCHYVSWRTKPEKLQESFDFEKGWVAPGMMLWKSIQAGYLLSVPIEPLLELESYVAQRLYTYLIKHCRPGQTFAISLRKLLPKIPLNSPLHKAPYKLESAHRDLVAAGFLSEMPNFKGRGEGRIVTYCRNSPSSALPFP
jgi:hypothetical protein